MAFSLKSTGLKQPEILDNLFANAQALGVFGTDVDLPPAVAAFLIRTPANSLSAGHVLLALDAAGEMVQMLICESANVFTQLLVNDIVPPAPVNGKFIDSTMQVFTASPFFLGQLPDALFPKTKPLLFVASIVTAPLLATVVPVAPVAANPADNYGKTDPAKENDRGALIAWALLNTNVFEGKVSDNRRKEVIGDAWKSGIRIAPDRFRDFHLSFANDLNVFKALFSGLIEAKPAEKGDVMFNIVNVFRDNVVPTDSFMFESYVGFFGQFLDATVLTGHFWQEYFEREVLPRLAKLSSNKDDSLAFKLDRLEDLLIEIGIKLRSPEFYNGTVAQLKTALSLLATFPKLTDQSFNTFCREATDRAQDAADKAAANPNKRHKIGDNKGNNKPPVLPAPCFSWCAFSASLDGFTKTCSFTKCRWSHGPFTKHSASAVLVEFRPMMEKKFTHALKCSAQLKKLSAWMSGAGGFAK